MDLQHVHLTVRHVVSLVMTSSAMQTVVKSATVFRLMDCVKVIYLSAVVFRFRIALTCYKTNTHKMTETFYVMPFMSYTICLCLTVWSLLMYSSILLLPRCVLVCFIRSLLSAFVILY